MTAGSEKIAAASARPVPGTVVLPIVLQGLLHDGPPCDLGPAARCVAELAVAWGENKASFFSVRNGEDAAVYGNFADPS